ncbi:MAG: energy-coupling factor transporter ATPase [Clostridiales bacterium]|nr:MAG: energy-coupling factor transporter ATPase [Clostridiales bacterium]
MSKIEIKNVSFAYDEGEDNIINNLNLTFNEGEFVAILGHNGSGKSTLAKLLNGLNLPSQGDVLVDGLNTKDIEKLFDIRSKVGMVFQNPDNQLIATIVEDDIAFGPENLGVEPSEIRTRINNSLSIVNMSKYIKKPPHQLSGGQKQRIAIAGILAMKPNIIVFDEPTSMLDPIGRREVLETIKKLNSQGISIILITHYMEEAMLADRVVVMKSGSVVLDDSPKEVFNSKELLEKLSLKLPDIVHIFTNLKKYGVFNDLNNINLDKITKGIIDFKKSGKKIDAPYNDGICKSEKDNTSQNILELDDVNFYYNKDSIYEEHAVKNISFTVKKGEFIGIIGHTGSGKSSLVQLLNGLNKIDSGTMRVLDFKTNDKPDYTKLRRSVGIVFQNPEYQLFEETVAKDIAFGPLNIGVSKENLDNVIDDALKAVDLDPLKYRDVSPFELSGGEKRRVAIAGVIAMNPEILILDEPASGLDPVSRDEVLDFIKKDHISKGKTTFIVSHDMREIARLCDRVLVLSDGKIVIFDTVKNVYKNRKKLLEIGLDVPTITLLTDALNNSGYFNIDEGIYDIDEWTNELLRELS